MIHQCQSYYTGCAMIHIPPLLLAVVVVTLTILLAYPYTKIGHLLVELMESRHYPALLKHKI